MISGLTWVHWTPKQLVKGVKYDEEVLVYRNDVPGYRLSVTVLASQYVSFLDIQFPEGLACGTETRCDCLALKVAKEDGLRLHRVIT